MPINVNFANMSSRTFNILKNLKNKLSAGPDDIPTKIL